MPTYSVIRKTDQVEVYRYEAPERIEWVDWPFATHDHAEVVVAPPPAPAPPVLEWERLVFLRRFTAPERIAIRSARANDAILNDFFSLLEQADIVHSNDPDVQAGMGYLVARGLLTAARRDAILGVSGG